jgi:hypothetical protein
LEVEGMILINLGPLNRKLALSHYVENKGNPHYTIFTPTVTAVRRFAKSTLHSLHGRIWAEIESRMAWVPSLDWMHSSSSPEDGQASI